MTINDWVHEFTIEVRTPVFWRPKHKWFKAVAHRQSITSGVAAIEVRDGRVLRLVAYGFSRESASENVKAKIRDWLHEHDEATAPQPVQTYRAYSRRP